MDIAVPRDRNILQKVLLKETEKYQDLASEIKRICKSRTKVVPVVVGASGSVSKRLAGHLEQLGLKDRTENDAKVSTPRSGTYLQKSVASLWSSDAT